MVVDSIVPVNVKIIQGRDHILKLKAHRHEAINQADRVPVISPESGEQSQQNRACTQFSRRTNVRVHIGSLWIVLDLVEVELRLPRGSGVPHRPVVGLRGKPGGLFFEHASHLGVLRILRVGDFQEEPDGEQCSLDGLYWRPI